MTTPKGARSLRKLDLPSSVTLAEAPAPSAHKEATIPAHSVLDAIAQIRSCSLVLVEGGPHLLGDFLAEHLIDEQFLTLSPQLIGRDDSSHELHLVEGQLSPPPTPSGPSST